MLLVVCGLSAGESSSTSTSLESSADAVRLDDARLEVDASSATSGGGALSMAFVGTASDVGLESVGSSLTSECEIVKFCSVDDRPCA